MSAAVLLPTYWAHGSRCQATISGGRQLQGEDTDREIITKLKYERRSILRGEVGLCSIQPIASTVGFSSVHTVCLVGSLRWRSRLGSWGKERKRV